MFRKRPRSVSSFLPKLLCAAIVFLAVCSASGQELAGNPAGNAGERLSPPEIVSNAAVVMDAATGTVVFSKNGDTEIPPASLTKLMTMHLAFREIAAGNASPDEIIVPGRESWAVNQEPGSSLMFLGPNQQLTLRELLLGMAVFSGNDAATATALRFAPTVEDFIGMMNREARSLGLEKTRFVDAAGYWEDNMTTAREFAEFCRYYLRAHPESLAEYHSVREFSYPGPENVAAQRRADPGTRAHRNNNTLLGTVPGVDGLKTGFIPESGYNIALTAERDGTRFVAVVLGAPAEWRGDRVRDEDGTQVLEWAFSRYKTIRPDSGALPPVRVWKGKDNYVDIVPAGPLLFTAPAERGSGLRSRLEYDGPLTAPLAAGSAAGRVVIYDSFGELRRVPLVTAADVPQGGFFKRLFDSIRLFFNRAFGADGD